MPAMQAAAAASVPPQLREMEPVDGNAIVHALLVTAEVLPAAAIMEPALLSPMSVAFTNVAQVGTVGTCGCGLQLPTRHVVPQPCELCLSDMPIRLKLQDFDAQLDCATYLSKLFSGASGSLAIALAGSSLPRVALELIPRLECAQDPDAAAEVRTRIQQDNSSDVL